MARNQKAVGLDLVRKGFYVTRELEKRLRNTAFKKRTTESEVVREALVLYFNHGDKEKASSEKN